MFHQKSIKDTNREDQESSGKQGTGTGAYGHQNGPMENSRTIYHRNLNQKKFTNENNNSRNSFRLNGNLALNVVANTPSTLTSSSSSNKCNLNSNQSNILFINNLCATSANCSEFVQPSISPKQQLPPPPLPQRPAPPPSRVVMEPHMKFKADGGTYSLDFLHCVGVQMKDGIVPPKKIVVPVVATTIDDQKTEKPHNKSCPPSNSHKANTSSSYHSAQQTQNKSHNNFHQYNSYHAYNRNSMNQGGKHNPNGNRWNHYRGNNSNQMHRGSNNTTISGNWASCPSLNHVDGRSTTTATATSGSNQKSNNQQHKNTIGKVEAQNSWPNASTQYHHSSNHGQCHNENQSYAQMAMKSVSPNPYENQSEHPQQSANHSGNIEQQQGPQFTHNNMTQFYYNSMNYDSDSSNSSNTHRDGHLSAPTPNQFSDSQYVAMRNFNDYYATYYPSPTHNNFEKWTASPTLFNIDGSPFYAPTYYKSTNFSNSSSSSENDKMNMTDENLNDYNYHNLNSSGSKGVAEIKKGSACETGKGKNGETDGKKKRMVNADSLKMTDIHTPSDRFLSKSHLFVTEKPPQPIVIGSPFDKISQNLWDRFMAAQQTKEKFQQKMELWRFLFVNIKKAFSRRYGLYLVGSTITGFGTDNSDIDMCLVSRLVTGNDPRTEALHNLTDFRNFLINTTNKFEHFHLIQAKVPILRFRDVNTGLEVDLNFNNSIGIRNTHLLYGYQQMDWRLKPLCVIVKLWAQFHHINDAKCSTISSYSLSLMVIHFLQFAVNPPILPCLQSLYPEKFQRTFDLNTIDIIETMKPFNTENKQTLGELFVQFLEYYSNFDYSQYAISVRVAGILPIEECRHARSLKNDPHQWRQLCIEEPFDLTNTAHSVYNCDVFEKIKQVFITSWKIMHETMDLNSIFSNCFLTANIPISTTIPNIIT